LLKAPLQRIHQQHQRLRQLLLLIPTLLRQQPLQRQHLLLILHSQRLQQPLLQQRFPPMLRVLMTFLSVRKSPVMLQRPLLRLRQRLLRLLLRLQQWLRLLVRCHQ
jgi:hypothetical protein